MGASRLAVCRIPASASSGPYLYAGVSAMVERTAASRLLRVRGVSIAAMENRGVVPFDAVEMRGDIEAMPDIAFLSFAWVRVANPRADLGPPDCLKLGGYRSGSSLSVPSFSFERLEKLRVGSLGICTQNRSFGTEMMFPRRYSL